MSNKPAQRYPCAPLECPFKDKQLTSANMMQTHCQGPLEPGNYPPLSESDMSKVKEEMKVVKEKTGWKEPDRGPTFNDPNLKWYFGKCPDYTLTN